MSNYILDCVCVTDNFRDGQKIIGARLKYDRPVDPKRISPAQFKVKGRRVVDLTVEGDTVTVNLDQNERAAYVVEPAGNDEPPKMRPGAGGPPKDMPEAFRAPRVVEVKQAVPIAAADGSEIPAFDDFIATTSAEEPVICDFIQDEFEGLPYNLYIPKEYDGTKQLPIVMFIHDAGPCGSDPMITLSQGSGAIAFACPEWQAEHPCFVFAPQVARGVSPFGPNQTGTPMIDKFVAALDDVVARYNIDRKRIYTTGQSMGCMASCEMNIRYPEYFAASLLVAGQWDAEKMAGKCTKCKFWILVSEHDARAFPGMNAVTGALEAKGVNIGHYWWDAKESFEQLTEHAYEAMKDDVDMRYTVFYGDSVVPANVYPHGGSNHTSTWNVVYYIKGVKEWLFSNVRD